MAQPGSEHRNDPVWCSYPKRQCACLKLAGPYSKSWVILKIWELQNFPKYFRIDSWYLHNFELGFQASWVSLPYLRVQWLTVLSTGHIGNEGLAWKAIISCEMKLPLPSNPSSPTFNDPIATGHYLWAVGAEEEWGRWKLFFRKLSFCSPPPHHKKNPGLSQRSGEHIFPT